MITSFWELKKLNPVGEPFCRAAAGRSFVKNFVGMLYQQASNGLAVTLTDVAGSSRALSAKSIGDLGMAQPGGGETILRGANYDNKWSENNGIIVGTGTTAVAYNNSALASKIEHGTAGGQLLHWGGLIKDTEVSAPYAYFDVSRIFENQSGGSITINELGLVATAFYSNQYYQFLICRDVLAEVDWVSLAHTEMLKVTYRIRVTV